MVQSRHKPPQHEPGEASHRKTRIENPTCETCRWFVLQEPSNMGFCYYQSPILGGSASRPMAHVEHFCSHHESAFKGEY